jgi:hypothetical protein
MIKTMQKEFITLNGNNITFAPNVRHAHLWGKDYTPNELYNYDIKDIIKMAVSICHNIINGNNPFDTEPVVYKVDDKYEIQVGNTRAISFICLPHLLENYIEEFEEFSEDDIETILHTKTANFVQVYEPYTDAQKRRENTVRSNQHWVATALGMYDDYKNKISIKSIATAEGVSISEVQRIIAFCKSGITLRKMAISGQVSKDCCLSIADLPKDKRKIIIENIDDDTELQNLDDFRYILKNSFYILPEDFPMHAFTWKGTTYDDVDKESWYMEYNHGMFTQHISTDREAANIRMDCYINMRNEELEKLYPEAKIYEDEWRVYNAKGTITEDRTCVHSEPILIKKWNGSYKVCFRCSTHGCSVHGFGIEKPDKQEITQKHARKVMKQNIEDLFVNDMFNEDSVILKINSIIYLAKKLTQENAYQEFAEYMNGMFNTYDIEYTMPHDTWRLHSDRLVVLDNIENLMKHEYINIITNIEYTYLKYNKHLENQIVSYFKEMDINVSTYNEVIDQEQENIQEKYENKDERITKKYESVLRREDNLNDFFVHLLGINRNGTHPEYKCKRHLLGIDMYNTIDNLLLDNEQFYFKFTTENKFTNKLARLFKLSKATLEELDMQQYVELLNAKINEYVSLVSPNHFNAESEELWASQEALLQAKEDKKEFLWQAIVRNQDILLINPDTDEIMQMILNEFQTAFNTKKLKLSSTEQPQLLINARAVGRTEQFNFNEIEYLIEFYYNKIV